MTGHLSVSEGPEKAGIVRGKNVGNAPGVPQNFRLGRRWLRWAAGGQHQQGEGATDVSFHEDVLSFSSSYFEFRLPATGAL